MQGAMAFPFQSVPWYRSGFFLCNGWGDPPPRAASAHVSRPRGGCGKRKAGGNHCHDGHLARPATTTRTARLEGPRRAARLWRDDYMWLPHGGWLVVLLCMGKVSQCGGGLRRAVEKISASWSIAA